MGASASLPLLAGEHALAARGRARRGGVLRPLRGLSDERLSALAALGDDDAFAMIATRYRPAIVRYCSSILLNQADAEDAAQTTMVKARAGLAARGEAVALRPWMFRIAHNEAVSLLRSRRPSESLDTLEDVLPARGEDALGVRARTHALVADLLELPERQRAALLLRELVGLSYGEIAGALGGTAAAITQSVFEGRRNLAQIEHGRGLECAGVQRSISDGDQRRLRGRALRAHMDDCHDCTRFASSITQRTVTLGLIFPLVAKGALVAGAGVFGAGGAPAAVSALGGGGAASVAKVAAVAAVLAGVGAGGVLVHQGPVRPKVRRAHHATVVRHAPPVRLSAAPAAAAPVARVRHHHHRVAPQKPAPAALPSTLQVSAHGIPGVNARIGPQGISATAAGATARVGANGISANAAGVSVKIAPGCIRIKLGTQVLPLGTCPH